MLVGIVNLRWRGKRSRHSWRMRNPQFYVSAKRPMVDIGGQRKSSHYSLCPHVRTKEFIPVIRKHYCAREISTEILSFNKSKYICPQYNIEILMLQMFCFPKSICIILYVIQIFPCIMYRQISNIRCTKSSNISVSRLVLQLSLPNPLNPGVNWRMKI